MKPRAIRPAPQTSTSARAISATTSALRECRGGLQPTVQTDEFVSRMPKVGGESGRESERDSRKNGHGETNQQNTPVNLDLSEPGQGERRRQEAKKRPDAGVCQSDAEQAATQGEQKALRQELVKNASATGAKGVPNGELVRTVVGSHQVEIGDVDATQDKHEKTAPRSTTARSGAHATGA
jgi:hypothetical protein